jgi:hypothetical protein
LIPNVITPATINDHKVTTSDARAAQLNVAGRDEMARIIIGRCRVGAVVPFATRYADSIYVFCFWGRSGPEGYDAIETLSMNDAALPAGATVVHHLGDQTTVDSTLATLLAGIGLGSFTNPLTGVCWTSIILPQRYYPPGWAPGYPVNIGPINAVVRGLKSFDHRDNTQSFASPSTWKYSNNPAVVTARFLTDSTLGIGAGAMSSAALATVDAAANYSDDVLLGGGKRFTVNMVLQDSAPANSVIKVLASYGSFYVVPDAGSYSFVMDAPATPGAAITSADILANSFSYDGIPLENRPNVVTCRYTFPHPNNPHAPWVTRVAPVAADMPAIPSGETRRVSEIPLHGATSYDQALRFAITRRNHFYVEDLGMKFRMKQAGLGLRVGDVRPITYGIFTAKQMRLLSQTLPDRLGYVDTVWQEYDPAAYSNTYTTTPTYPDTQMPDPFAAPPAITGLTLTEVVATSAATASPMSKIKATCTASTWPYLAGYLFTFTDDDAGVSSSAKVYETLSPEPECITPFLLSPAKYRCVVRAISSITQAGGPYMTDTIAVVQTSTIQDEYWKYIETTNGQIAFGSSTVADQPPSGASVTLFNTRFKVYDLGSVEPFCVTISTLASFLASNPTQRAFLQYALEDGIFSSSQQTGGSVIVSARYIRLFVTRVAAGDPIYDMTGCVITATLPVVAEDFVATTSASGMVVTTLKNRYLKRLSVQVTPRSAAGAIPSYEDPIIGELLPNTVAIESLVSGSRVVRDCSVTMTGVAGSKAKTDWALTANGGSAFVSSALSGFGANFLNDGNLQASNTGGNIWVSSTTSFDQWAQVSFASAKPITEVVGYFLRDDYTSIRETSIYDVATLYNPTSFEWQYYNGTSFVTFAGGTITGFGFAMSRLPVNVTTTAVRILIHAANGGYSRVAAIQALGPT